MAPKRAQGPKFKPTMGIRCSPAAAAASASASSVTTGTGISAGTVRIVEEKSDTTGAAAVKPPHHTITKPFIELGPFFVSFCYGIDRVREMRQQQQQQQQAQEVVEYDLEDYEPIDGAPELPAGEYVRQLESDLEEHKESSRRCAPEPEDAPDPRCQLVTEPAEPSQHLPDVSASSRGMLSSDAEYYTDEPGMAQPMQYTAESDLYHLREIAESKSEPGPVEPEEPAEPAETEESEESAQAVVDSNAQVAPSSKPEYFLLQEDPLAPMPTWGYQQHRAPRPFFHHPDYSSQDSEFN